LRRERCERFVSKVLLALLGENGRIAGLKGLGGYFMPKRLVNFLTGNPDAVPGDYILAIVAVIGMIFATLAQILSQTL
jgi:hypothetical protein